MPKDIGTSTPAGTENPGIIDDVIRERGTIEYNLYKIKFVGTDTTLLANDTWVIGSSSSTSMLISFPAPSSCASTAVSKPFVITNAGTTTMVLNIVVNGVGSRTVSGSETVCLFTDGIRWYEQVNFPNIGTQTIGKLNLGTQTAGTISLGTQTVGTIALGTQTSGTLSLGTQTSGTLALGTQTSGLLSLGTQTSGLLSFGTQTYGTIALGTQTSGTLGLGTQTSGLLSLGTQTLGLLSLGTQTNGQIDFTLQTGKVSLGTQTNGQLDFPGQTGKISLGTQTNNTISLGSQTSGLLSLGTQTNGTLSLGTQTSGTISLTTQSTGNYLSSWTTGSQTTAATGTVRFNSSGDVTVTSTYDSNGNGTITTAVAAGISAKPDAKVDGVVQVTNPTAYAFPGTRVSITATNTTEALITFKNIGLGTQTSGLLSLATQTTSLLSIATQTTNALAWDRLTGLPTDNQYFREDSVIVPGTATIPIRRSDGILPLYGSIVGSETVTNLNPTRINFAGTTTEITGTQTSPVWYTLKGVVAGAITSNIHNSPNVLLYVAADAGGSSTTFTDTSSYQATLTRTANAVSSSAWSEFGGASYWGSTGYLAVGTTTSGTYNIFGTDTCYISAFIKMDSLADNMGIFSIGQASTLFYYSGAGGNGLALNIGGAGVILQGNTTGWSASTRYHVALRMFSGSGYQLLRDGLVVASGTNSTAWSMAGNPLLGSSEYPWKGYIDDFYWEKNTNGTSTVPTAAKTGTETIYANSHYIYSSYYIPANATTPFLTIIDDGTNSVKPQMIIGSTTSSATTTTGIKLEVVGGKVRADQFISPSEESKKVVYPEKTVNYLDELKNIRIGEWSWKENDVDRLDAEATAKKDYIQNKRQSWIDANKANYSSTVLEPGTGTVTKIDTIKMAKDYKTYIELDWASLPEQTKLINEVENRLAAGENPDIHMTAFAGDPTTPAIMQSKSKKELSLNDQIGWNMKVSKELYSLAVAQQMEIGSLTAALENMRVMNNLK